MTTHSWLNPKCQVRPTKCGRGVFCTATIVSGEHIAIFGGHIMPVRNEPVFGGGGDYALQISDDFVLGTKYEHELADTDFFNHSCEPNSGFHGQIVLAAMRDIQPDEEITFDYAMCLNPVDGRTYEFHCACGSPSCRSKVTACDWQIPELQARYAGWFQWYLQEKINSLKFKSAVEPAHSKRATPL